jgi:signal transduction histidine kinase
MSCAIRSRRSLRPRKSSISRNRAQRKDVEQHAKAIIRRQVRHLGKLTDDLLDAARVMMGKIVLDRRPVDFAQVVSNTVDTLRNTGQLQRHECVTRLESVWVNVDPTRLDQVLANLLTNAVKYTPPPGRIEVSLRREHGEAVFSVRDSGLGLEAELLPRIFDLFVQGERGLDRSQGGLGIGLTLVGESRSCTAGTSKHAATALAKAASSSFVCRPSIRPLKLRRRSSRHATRRVDESR